MSIRINGGRVKSAALAHASKQLRHLGYEVMNGCGHVTFQGQTAYAIWRRTGQKVSSFSINYPALPDNALVTRPEADLISAYTLHEIGHVAFTDNAGVHGIQQREHGRLLFALWNGIEDARIEHAMIASGKARGARSMFKKLMGRYTSQLDMAAFNPTSINSAPFALALICRAALGDGNGFAKTLLGRIPAPHHGLYKAAADAMSGMALDFTGTAHALAAAEKFLADWQQLFPGVFKQPPPPPSLPLPSEPEQGDDADEDPESPEESGEDADDSEQLSDSADSADDADDADEDEDGEDADEDEDGDSDWDAEDDEDDEDDSEGAKGGTSRKDRKGGEDSDLSRDMEAYTESVDDDDQLFNSLDDSDDDDDEDSSDPGNGGSAPDFSAAENDLFSEEQLFTPEPNVDQIFHKAAARVTGRVIDLPARGIAPRSDMAFWPSIIDRKDDSIRRSFRLMQKNCAMPALKSQLHRLLKAPEMHGWDAGAMGGRFDGKRAPRMLAGSEQVFKRRWVADGIDTAVSIIIDMSGSMKGKPIAEAVDLAWTIADACQSARADVEVLGFTDNNMSASHASTSGTTLDGKYVSKYDTNTQVLSDAKLVVVKGWRSRVERVAHHFTALKKCAFGSTPDYSAVKSVCTEMAGMRHARKLVIVITDGFGEISAMKALTTNARAIYGVDVIGFGIGCGKMLSEAYAFGAPVNLYNLHKVVLKSIAKQLEQSDTRRVA